MNAAVIQLPPRVDQAKLLVVQRQVCAIRDRQRALLESLRELERLVGTGPWLEDLVVAAEKCEASGFWARESIKHVERSLGCDLLGNV